MKEYLVDHRNYFTFSDRFTTDLVPEQVDRLVFKSCGHGRIYLSGARWKNLQVLVIQGGRFLDLKIDLSASHLREIMILNVKYAQILEMKGDYPDLKQWSFDHCKYLVIKGPFIANSALETLQLIDCPQFRGFEEPGIFPALQTFEITGCSHSRIDLAKVEFPHLETLIFDQCKYLQIRHLGSIFSSLQHLKMNQCEKMWLPDAELARVKQFPGFEFVPVPKLAGTADTINELGTFPVDATGLAAIEEDSAIIKQEFDQADVEARQEQEMLASQEAQGDIPEEEIITKFCPECGTRAPRMAGFCPNCGNPFRI